ncbi:cytochrome P450 [Ceratobasidium sp. AG-I]|nr:cytochrome P450 [Ceratobasidium sp. AG-I]
MSVLLNVSACVALLIAVQFVRMVIIGRQLKAHSYVFIAHTSLLRLLVPSWTNIPKIIYGNVYGFMYKYSEFQRAGKDAYVQVSITNPSWPCFFVADPQAIKEITRARAPFVPGIRNAAAFTEAFGPNLLTLEGEEWKQHRKITQHAFTEKNVQLVCAETITALEQLFTLWDKNYGQRVHVPHLALMVISSAAFGQKLTWMEDTEKPEPGFDVSFHKAILMVSQTVIRRRITPAWAESWTKTNRDMVLGFNELKRYLQLMVAAHRDEGGAAQDSPDTSPSTDNLFNILMKASKEDRAEKGDGLSDEEITGKHESTTHRLAFLSICLGNAFLFLMAGHETTANALAFSLGLLALYPEIQQEAYLQVKQAMTPGSGLTYASLKDLKLVSGTLYEALRMYPPVLQVMRITEKDTMISVARNTPRTDEHDREDLFIPANSCVAISVIGTHYNPKYWPEPEEFRPSRFSESYNKDAFLSWSTGRRACIGQKFAETEGIAALAAMLARYEISIDQVKFPAIPGESMNARRERLLRPALLITLAPEKLPLVFIRR